MLGQFPVIGQQIGAHALTGNVTALVIGLVTSLLGGLGVTQAAQKVVEVLKQRGKALLYTTHYMEEVERLADRVVVMDHGKIIANDTIAGLQAQVPVVAGQRASLETVRAMGYRLRDDRVPSTSR